jgi:hypothetical protein
MHPLGRKKYAKGRRGAPPSEFGVKGLPFSPNRAIFAAVYLKKPHKTRRKDV